MTRADVDQLVDDVRAAEGACRRFAESMAAFGPLAVEAEKKLIEARLLIGEAAHRASRAGFLTPVCPCTPRASTSCDRRCCDA